MKQKIIDNIKTIFYALVIAIVIRSLFIQPFYIPSSSMEPTLLVGDRIFVTKYTYGYSKHSFPFSLGPIKKRVFFDEPERGDIIVFKTPADNRTDYIKRLIGGPGDKIQFIDGNLYLNDVDILKSKVKLENEIYLTAYNNFGSYQNSDEFVVPDNHYFFLGDNRDCSKDSRFLTSVGYVHRDNIVGKARFIFFSTDKKIGRLIEFWKWNKSFRLDRFFKKIR